jgi:hypothetical protein
MHKAFAENFAFQVTKRIHVDDSYCAPCVKVATLGSNKGLKGVGEMTPQEASLVTIEPYKKR